MVTTLRAENASDHNAIFEVNRLAFGREEEGRLVNRLREEGVAIVSIVAVEGNDIVGHIIFSDLPIHTQQGLLPAASLAPLAVRPECQRRGIGSKLVRSGLAACRALDRAAILVLGHPHYYPRFGFSSTRAKNIQSPFSGEGDAWMAMELKSDALLNVGGHVRYPEAFGIVS